jgi:Protein of unknown function (DUF2726)
MVKKLLNLHEEAIRSRLKAACSEWGATVFAKVRIADVLPIENSGISDADFRFALRSHFDFVVCDAEHTPLFAVEFDGPSHDKPEQARRDIQKNGLCERFQFPILRINARYLVRKYGTFDLLSWFVHVWFLVDGFRKAQEQRTVPADEVFDPAFVVSLGGFRGLFPLWLSAQPLIEIQRLNKAGRCYDFCPSYFIGLDEAGTYRAIAYLRITEDSGTFVTTAMRSQLFPFADSEILHEILMQEVYERTSRTLEGKEAPVPLHEIQQLVRTYQQRYTLASAGWLGSS